MVRRLRARRRAAALVFIASLLAVAGPSRAAVHSPLPDAVAGQALVRFRPGTPDATRAAVHARLGAVLLRRIPELGVDVVAVPGPIDRYKSEPAVAHVEPNFRGHVQLHPNDPCFEEACIAGPYGSQWNAAWDNAEFGWDAYPNRFSTSADRQALLASDALRLPKVAVLDTKIDTSHADWIAAGGTSVDVRNGGMLDMADARDYVTPDRRSGSASYHGTFVAGILGAAPNNKVGITGMGYMSQLMPVSVVDGQGATDAATLAAGVLYAWQKGARVINLSLGMSDDSETVHLAIKTVTGAAAPGDGVTPPVTGPALVVAAAGNNMQDTPVYPGFYPEVMSVSGTDTTDRRASCSNYNANVSVSAPADGLVSLREAGGVLKGACGTSSAAPQVSALAAMLFSQQPSRTAAQVRATIERTVDDRGPTGKDPYFGYGRINMERALRYGNAITVTGVAASIPPAAGGVSSIGAVAVSSKPITAAEYYLDDPGCMGGPGTPMTVSNISSSTYQLSADLPVNSSTTTGVHSIFVRATDGSTWSAASVGPLYVDRTAPGLTGVQTNMFTLREAARPLLVDFTIVDDFSTHFVAAMDITGTTGPNEGKRVCCDELKTGLLQGPYRWTWMPGPEVPPGLYRAVLGVADEAGNVRKVVLSANVLVA